MTLLTLFVSTWISHPVCELCCCVFYMQGSIPQIWMDMQGGPAVMRLQRFACAYCNLTGSLPYWGSTTCAPTSSSLQFFDVSHNGLTGAVPTGFNSFGTLQAFNISYNQLSGELLASSSCPSFFPQLQQVRMSHNSFTAIPSGKWLLTVCWLMFSTQLQHKSCCQICCVLQLCPCPVTEPTRMLQELSHQQLCCT